MYNFINIVIHLTALIFIIFACIPDSQYRADEFTLQDFARKIAIGLVVCWAFIIGEVHNFKSLIALFL